MYIPKDDVVVPLDDVPQSSVGAPLPVLVASEHRLLLAYYVEEHDPAWDGTWVRMVGHDTPDQSVAVVDFRHPYAHRFGPPNDEAFSGHPLSGRGLHPYGAFEVRGSSWIRELERMNAVHPYHRPERFYAGKRHFVLAFHDSTFECVAEGYQTSLRRGSLLEVLAELAGRLE